jgi:UDPglucose 6-dehydrogenase
MRISVIGCGYLGAVHAACLAELGHEVVGIDVDAAKVDALNAGRSPFYEPGFPALLASGLESGRLRFDTDPAATAGSAVHFLTVGTPQAPDGSADLRHVHAAVESLMPHLRPGDLVVGKSTVPVGTAEGLLARLEQTGTHLAWNPEFLREGFAVQDTLAPDRIVYGVEGGDERAVDQLDKVYERILATHTPRLVMDFATAELVKVAANAFLATKISFINAMAEISEVAGADVTLLADAIGYDARIGRRFLNAGAGFGGGCLPKDIRALTARAEELGVGKSVAFLREVDAINLRQRERVVDLAIDLLGGDPAGARIAVLGLAFKPDSDDVRDSPALDICDRLARVGAHVVATDPQAIETARLRAPDIEYAPDAVTAATGADLVILVTEWPEFRELDPGALGAVVGTARMIDARNCLAPADWLGAGWTYRGLGRG